MAFDFNWSPYSAVSAASRIMGQSQRAREEEERRRRQAESDRQFALDSQRLIDANAARSFDQGQKVAEFQEGQRRFDVGLQTDAYNRQSARDAAQQNLVAQLQARHEGDMADLYGRQMGIAGDRAMLQDRLGAGLLEQQMEADAAAARGAALGQRQQDLAQMQGDIQLTNRLMTAQVPQEIQAGLQMGALRYSEHQKAERKKLQDSIDAARRDPKLTMAERARFAAQQMQAISEINNNPEEVPPDERPVPLEQQFAQSTFEHPTLGPMQIEWRNGAPKFVPVDSAYKNPQLEQQKVAAAEAEDRRKEEAARRKSQLDQWKWQADFQKDIIQNQYKQAQEALQNTQPYREDPKYEKGKDEDGNAILDSAAFDKDNAEWEAKSRKLHAEHEARLAQYSTIPAQLNEPMAANFPMMPGMQQQAPMPQQQSVPAPFQQPPAAPPMEQPPEDEAPVPVASREEIDALPQGALYIAPDGSVWRK